MKHTPLNKNSGKLKEQCSKTRTILSAIRWQQGKPTAL